MTDFKKRLANKQPAQTPPGRYSAPQVDPTEAKPAAGLVEEPAPVPPSVEQAPVLREAVLVEPLGDRPVDVSPVQTEESEATAKPPRVVSKRQLYLTPVDKTEKNHNVTLMMYPSRQDQLMDLEIWEGRKRWKIIDQAIDEYLERHYGVNPTASDDSGNGRRA